MFLALLACKLVYQTIQYFLSFFEYLDRSPWWTLKENDQTEYVLGHGDRSRDEPMWRSPWPERRVSPKVRQSARPISATFFYWLLGPARTFANSDPPLPI
jgi:hypothetical protein